MASRECVSRFTEIPEVATFSASPGGEWVAFLWDPAGETELYVQHVEGGRRRRVTDGECPERTDAHASALRWGPDSERLYFRAVDRRREQGWTDVHVARLDGETEPVVTGDALFLPWDVHPDGTLYYLKRTGPAEPLVLERDCGDGDSVRIADGASVEGGISPSGDRLAVPVDDDGVETRITRPDGTFVRSVGPDGFRATAWSPDGRYLLGSDAGRERVGVFDLETEGIEWFTGENEEDVPITFLSGGDRCLLWRATFGEGSPPSGPRVCALDGSVRPLSLDDGPRDVLWTVPLAQSIGDGCRLGPDAFLARRKTATRPHELLRYDLSADEYDRLVGVGSDPLPTESFVEPETVTIETDDGTAVDAVLYVAGERPSPVVVHVYGGMSGGWDTGLDRGAQLLIDRGYSVVKPQGLGNAYRHNPHFTAVGRWLRRREWVDEDRVGLFGFSHGGYDVAMQSVRAPAVWAAGVSWNGVTDLLAHDERGDGEYLRRRLGNPAEQRERWVDNSPVTHVESFDCPLLLLQGIHDSPETQLRAFRDALERAGFAPGEDFEYVELDQGHDPVSGRQRTDAWTHVVDFLDRRL